MIKKTKTQFRALWGLLETLWDSWRPFGTLGDPSGLLETLREPLNIHAPLGTDKLESQLMGKNF